MLIFKAINAYKEIEGAREREKKNDKDSDSDTERKLFSQCSNFEENVLWFAMQCA